MRLSHAKKLNFVRIEPMEAVQAGFYCSNSEISMGKNKKDALRVNLDKKLKLEFHVVKVTGDAGLLAYREINNVFELTHMGFEEPLLFSFL